MPRLGKTETAAAPPAGEDEDEGQELYEILSEAMAAIPTSRQMEIGLALQSGAEWSTLPAESRALFVAAASAFLDGEDVD